MRQTLQRLRNLMLFLMLSGLAGCATKHVIHSPGETGIILKRQKADAAFADKTGQLVEGQTTIPAGTFIRLPKDDKETLETLRAMGVKLPDEKK